jgi:hypothetical protein
VPVIGSAATDEVVDTVWKLEGLPDVRTLVGLLA